VASTAAPASSKGAISLASSRGTYIEFRAISGDHENRVCVVGVVWLAFERDDLADFETLTPFPPVNGIASSSGNTSTPTSIVVNLTSRRCAVESGLAASMSIRTRAGTILPSATSGTVGTSTGYREFSGTRPSALPSFTCVRWALSICLEGHSQYSPLAKLAYVAFAQDHESERVEVDFRTLEPESFVDVDPVLACRVSRRSGGLWIRSELTFRRG
jgi:hypothetical protein